MQYVAIHSGMKCDATRTQRVKKVFELRLMHSRTHLNTTNGDEHQNELCVCVRDH